MKKIIIVRHGESFKNTEGRWDGCLTTDGTYQITKTFSKYLDLSPSVIYSSPYSRCRESAEIISNIYHKQVSIDFCLREYEYEGQTIQADLLNFAKTLVRNLNEDDCAIVVTHGTPAIMLANLLQKDPGWRIVPEWKDQWALGEAVEIGLNNSVRIYDYPMHCITCDALVSDDEGKVLLVKKISGQFSGKWALPGGHLDENELLEDCALRELQEECGLKYIGSRRWKQAPRVYDVIDRDPRGRKINHLFSYQYNEFVHCDKIDDGECGEAKFFSKDEIKSMDLAVDHKKIILEPFYA